MIVLLLAVSAPVVIMLLHLLLQRTVYSAGEPGARLKLVIRIVVGVTVIWGILTAVVLWKLPAPLLLLNMAYVMVVVFGLGMCYFNVFALSESCAADPFPARVVCGGETGRPILECLVSQGLRYHRVDRGEDRPTAGDGGGTATGREDPRGQRALDSDREAFPLHPLALAVGAVRGRAGRSNFGRLERLVADAVASRGGCGRGRHQGLAHRCPSPWLDRGADGFPDRLSCWVAVITICLSKGLSASNLV